jgi:hypothetical protein
MPVISERYLAVHLTRIWRGGDLHHLTGTLDPMAL